MTRPNAQCTKTQHLKNYVILNEKYLKEYEKTYFRKLIKHTNFKQKYLDTAKFIEKIKQKRKQTHGFEAKFFLKVFSEMGASYGQLEKPWESNNDHTLETLN